MVDEDLVDSLRRHGATSRKTARALADLPAISIEHFAVLRETGLVREAGHGKYYLDEGVGARPVLPKWHPFTPFRVVLMTAVWLVALLAPLIVVLFW